MFIKLEAAIRMCIRKVLKTKEKLKLTLPFETIFNENDQSIKD